MIALLTIWFLILFTKMVRQKNCNTNGGSIAKRENGYVKEVLFLITYKCKL